MTKKQEKKLREEVEDIIEQGLLISDDWNTDRKEIAKSIVSLIKKEGLILVQKFLLAQSIH